MVIWLGDFVVSSVIVSSCNYMLSVWAIKKKLEGSYKKRSVAGKILTYYRYHVDELYLWNFKRYVLLNNPWEYVRFMRFTTSPILVSEPSINDVGSHDVTSSKLMSLGCYMGPLIIFQVSLR